MVLRTRRRAPTAGAAYLPLAPPHALLPPHLPSSPYRRVALCQQSRRSPVTALT